MEKSQSPLNGNGAYAYDQTKTENLIGRGEYGIVLKAIRIHDQQIFAIKISKKQISGMYLDEDEKQDIE
jgi:serine/threonine protein kinase